MSERENKNNIIGNDWDLILEDEFSSDYYKKLRKFLINEYRSYEVYPDAYDIFNAFKYTPYKDVRVVILGQDPYHEPGQAHGLAFSVKPGVNQPPSLVNIFKELKDDLDIERPPKDCGCLTAWARQGALLLNTCLTVRAHIANSHKGKGWELFTDRVIKSLADKEEPVVFMLWGQHARSKKSLITSSRHLILEGAHPSPFSAYNGFFGGRYFSRCNKFLEENGFDKIDWNIC
jgi:uracil-DNA glycosylase